MLTVQPTHAVQYLGATSVWTAAAAPAHQLDAPQPWHCSAVQVPKALCTVCRPWHRAAPAAAAPAVAPQHLLSGSPVQALESVDSQAQELEDARVWKRPRLSSPDQLDLFASPPPSQQQQQQQTPGRTAFEVSPGHYQVMPGLPALHVAKFVVSVLQSVQTAVDRKARQMSEWTRPEQPATSMK